MDWKVFAIIWLVGALLGLGTASTIKQQNGIRFKDGLVAVFFGWMVVGFALGHIARILKEIQSEQIRYIQECYRKELEELRRQESDKIGLS